MSIVKAGGLMEVPISYLVARHKTYGFRLSKFPERFRPKYNSPETTRPIRRETKLEQYWELKSFFSRLEAAGFQNGDFEYWVAFVPEISMVCCRGCGLPVRNTKASRKEHLKSGKCATIVRLLEKEVQKSPWCSSCGTISYSPIHWSWNFKFCSRECMNGWRISLVMAGPTLQRLKIIRKQFEIY